MTLENLSNKKFLKFLTVHYTWLVMADVIHELTRHGRGEYFDVLFTSDISNVISDIQRLVELDIENNKSYIYANPNRRIIDMDKIIHYKNEARELIALKLSDTLVGHSSTPLDWE